MRLYVDRSSLYFSTFAKTKAMTSDYLESVRKQFQYYKLLGDKTMAAVPEEGIHWQYNAESNSIATIVKHLHGNMLSRWTDFLTSDGEKRMAEA